MRNEELGILGNADAFYENVIAKPLTPASTRVGAVAISTERQQ